jgi:xanthine dehydrogenase small subunit
MSSETTFVLNGKPVELGRTDPTQPLLRWLHRHGLHGTKEGCGDGDCGACTVALVEVGADGRASYRAVNSCLLPVGLLPGREVATVEALADGEQLHPVQQALVECSGSQCGYCTPGFVMSLFCATHDAHAGALGDDAIAGNLCRCTGYAPIRAAARRLAAPATDDRFAASLREPRLPPTVAALGEFFSPTTVEAALALKASHPYASWIAGGTDLGVELGHHKVVAPAFIALDRIASLQALEIDAARVRIGAGVPLERVRREAAGVFPALDAMLAWFAGRQVRNRATLGGNLGTASPIGDLLPVLLALDATIELRGPQGARTVTAADYFLDYRKTARQPDELIIAVELERRPNRVDAAYKVAKRQTDDISIVAAAFALVLDPQRRVDDVRLAFGGVAAIPKRASATEAFLRGRRLDAATVAEAWAKLEREFAPLDDHRGSADYRRALCANLFATFVEERAP